jgi:uncharacterized membrane protein
MKLNRTLSIGGGIVLATSLYSAWKYATLPDQMPMHFNARGEVDRYGSKLEAVLFCPILMAVLLAVFVLIPRMLPEGKKIDPFQKAWDTVVITVMGFMACVQFMILNPGMLGTGTGQVRFMMAAMSILFIILGNMMGKTERNYVMGIRTPWTLESDEVWHRTHRLGGQLMVGAGVVCLPLALLGVNVLVLIAIIMVSSLYPVWYSYALYKKLYPGEKS